MCDSLRLLLCLPGGMQPVLGNGIPEIITCDVEASGYTGGARPDPDQQKSDLAVTPIDEKEDVCDAYYDYVIKIVVKGNLKHRIEKLGTEKEEFEMTAIQRILRRIAKEQVQTEWTWKENVGGYERPEWTNGAFVYLSKGHARKIKDVIERRQIVLQSKHLLVSPQYYQLVKDALQVTVEGPGREAFLLRRAGVIDEEGRIELGEKPKTRWLMLDPEIMKEKTVSMELLEYLTAPPSVQEMCPEGWIKAWEHVCWENSWLEMKEYGYGGSQWKCPFCTLCGAWAEAQHLVSKECLQKRKVQNCEEPGPLLKAILQAERVCGIMKTAGKSNVSAGGNRAGDTYNTYAPAHGQLKTTRSTTQQQANKNLLTSLSSR